MVFKMLILIFSVLLGAKLTLGKMDCEISPFDICGRPKAFVEIPREVSDLEDSCGEVKSYLKCAKEYQDECGMGRLILFRSDDLFEATYNAVSDVCEEGTLLNSVAIENLKCMNETFGKTNCRKEADDFIDPHLKRFRESEDVEPQFSFFCLSETHTADCVLRAMAENCGKLAEEATLDFILRSKSLEYSCDREEAQTVLDALKTLDLGESKKQSMAQLLEKVVEETSN